jgi:hypothetical protein
MAAAAPPDEPEIEVTMELPRSEFNALQRLARSRGIPISHAIREAISAAQFVQGLLDEGCTILLRRPDGSVSEIEF